MSTITLDTAPVDTTGKASSSKPQRGLPKRALSNAVFGMLIFVTTEVMFFTALISSLVVIKSTKGYWVPPQNIVLPVYATAFNTAVLLLSGVFMYLAVLRKKTNNSVAARAWLFRALLFGAFFVFNQGQEWVSLMGLGMTMDSSIFAATFYLLIGSHGLHALAGVAVLFYMYIKNNKLDYEAYKAGFIFWAFIVGVWPVLYALVYF